MKKKSLLLMVVALLLSGMILMTGGCSLIDETKRPGGNDDVQLTEPALTSAEAVEEVIAIAGPAVVTITTKEGGRANTDSLFNDPNIREYFADPFFGGIFDDPSILVPEHEGLGTGFIISKDGYILTNEHVVNGAESISVEIDGFDEPVEAKVVGADYQLDLALLKIDTKKELSYLKMGNSDQIRVGNWVIAIGSPYGLDHTVTIGVISAKGRPVTVEDRQYENLLQTDASINPGNSGGPLLNLDGEVIGINTAINAQAQGIGFAIPTSTVQRVMEDLKSGASATIPWIGVQVRDIDESAARYLGLTKLDGVLVTGVINGSPAEKAGLQQWDVILEFNGVKTNTADDLIAEIRKTKVEQKAEILYFRDRQLETLDVNIAERPGNLR